MKRNGKFEGKKQAADANKKQVKSLLLQTYFTSLLCLVLCVSMFFGTSYAWFTSEVSSTDNQIYVGTLSVGLTKGENVNLIGTQEKLFSGDVRWEPGYTSLETIHVHNYGDLDFKYVMNFTEGERKKGEEGLETVASCFEVWVFDHAANTQKGYTKPTSFAEIKAEGSGWKNPGTLDEVLAGKIVLSGELEADKNKNDEVFSMDTYTIALHMDEGTAARVMGHKISLSVKLVAYQMTSEADGLGNTQYGDVAVASNAEDLREVLSERKNVVLTNDVVISDSKDCLVLQGNVLDGGKNTITYKGDKVSGNPVGVINVNGGSLSNLTIKGGENGIALNCTNLTSNLVASNCTFEGANAFYLNSGVESSHSIFFNDCNFNSWVSYDNMIEHVYFNDCSFASILKPDCNTTLTDCTLTFDCLDVSALDSGVEIKLINCTYNNVKIDNAIVTKNGIKGTDAIKIAEGKVILSNT